MSKLQKSSEVLAKGRQLGSHGSEVLRCLALGLRDALHPKLALLSLMVGVCCLLVCLAVFGLFWQPIWGNITGFSTYLLSGWLSWLGNIPYFDLLLSVLMLLLCFILLVIVCSRMILEIILMSRIQSHVLRHYPDLSACHRSSMWTGIWNTLRILPIMILAAGLLIIPVLGGVLFFLVVTFLNMRGLCFDALDSVATPEEIHQIIDTKRRPMVLLASLTGVFPLIPLLGFLTPVILGASATHYCFRRLQELRATDDVIGPLPTIDAAALFKQSSTKS